jgi:hypothetical protein
VRGKMGEHPMMRGAGIPILWLKSRDLGGV